MEKKSFKKKLVFKIPLQMTLLLVGVMLVIGIMMSVLLSKQMTAAVESQIDLIAQSNANKAIEYLSIMEARGQALADEIAGYDDLDEATLDKMMVNSAIATLDDERIFATFISFEPNSYFANTPNGRSYYAYRNGEESDMVIEDENYSEEEYYTLSKETSSTHLIEPYA